MTRADSILNEFLPKDSTVWAHRDTLVGVIRKAVTDAMLDYTLQEKLNFADTHEEEDEAIDDWLMRRVG